MELREEILSGKAMRERKLAIGAGGVGLSPEERVELLTVLAKDPDEAVSGRAANALITQPVEYFVTALARPDASPELFHYCAGNLAEKPGIADAMAQNLNCPADDLIGVAPRLSPAMLGALVENLERLSTAPGLATVLAAHPAATIEHKHLLAELLKEEGIDAEAMDEAAAAVEPDKKKRESLIQRLNKMRVVERIQLALKGNREERMALIRDPNKLVQRAVLQSARTNAADAEGYASMASLTDEILRLIAMNRGFMKNYRVVKNLITNPKTPLDVSMHLLQRLNATDLKFLTMNKNVSETLRTMATKMQKLKKTGG